MTNQNRFFISLFCALAIGAAVRTGYPWLIIFSAFAPALFLFQDNRRQSWCCSLVYYLGAISALPHAVMGFFGPGHARAVLLYLAAAALLSLPWLLVWGKDYIWLRSIAGVLLGVVPPLGLIGWASPLMAAGWLFPSFALVGVLLLFAFVATAAEAVGPQRSRTLFALAAYFFLVGLSCEVNIDSQRPDSTSRPWEGVTLHASANSDAVAQYSNVLLMQKRAETSTADVLVFPEGAEENWSEVTEFTWADTFSKLRQKHQIALIGATSLEAGTRYRNGLVIRGAETDRFQQRIPVPLAMWHPFSRSSGVPLRLFSPGSVRIAGDSVGVLMCYEMTIPWPALATLAEHPTRLVGMANDWWAVDAPSVPRSQATALQGWARLADIPSTMAVNLPKDMTL